jgi:hypothetical protein
VTVQQCSTALIQSAEVPRQHVVKGDQRTRARHAGMYFFLTCYDMTVGVRADAAECSFDRLGDVNRAYQSHCLSRSDQDVLNI